MISTIEIQRPDRGGDAELLAAPLTMAAEPANLRNQRDKDRLSGVLLRSRITAAEAWKWFARIGEVHFALTRAAKIAGYAKIMPVNLSPSGEVDSVIESGLAADTIAGVYSRFGGLRGLIERYFLHQKIAGESHLIRWMDSRSQDGYMFASSKELDDGTVGSAGVAIAERAKAFSLKMTTMPNVANLNSAFEKTIAQKDYLGRVWTPSPEWLDVPDSPLGALNRQCDMLDTMTRNMHAGMKSRFAMVGILYFSQAVREAYGGQKDTSGKTTLEILYDLMKQNLITAEDTADVTSIIPILMMGEAEPGKVMEHLTIDREIFEGDLALRSELIDRILFGLDINAPSTKGNEETSHWGAWQNSADELRLAVIPELDSFCWTIDRLILRPAILASSDTDLRKKMNTGTIGVRFELDEASVRANRAADARELRKQGLIKGLSAVKASGFRQDDLLTGTEYIQWLGQLLRVPKLACYGTPEWESIDWLDPALAAGKTGRIGQEGDDEPSAPGEGDPGSPDDSDSDTPKKDKPI
jgi:hypothetical protein